MLFIRVSVTQTRQARRCRRAGDWAADEARMFSQTGEFPCQTISTPTSPFTSSSKRRKGFPSETHVKRGLRVVHGDIELLEKLGRNDLCPCGSGRRFKRCCLR